MFLDPIGDTPLILSNRVTSNEEDNDKANTKPGSTVMMHSDDVKEQSGHRGTDKEHESDHEVKTESNINGVDSMNSKNSKWRVLNHVIEAAESKDNLFDFLKTHDNYKSFASCLGHYFALENLIFMEKV